jgi:hypothetical protein
VASDPPKWCSLGLACAYLVRLCRPCQRSAKLMSAIKRSRTEAPRGLCLYDNCLPRRHRPKAHRHHLRTTHLGVGHDPSCAGDCPGSHVPTPSAEYRAGPNSSCLCACSRACFGGCSSRRSRPPAARPYLPLSAVSYLGGFRTPAAERAVPSLKQPASETTQKLRHCTAASISCAGASGHRFQCT